MLRELTLKQLEYAGVCLKQVDKFKELFGQSVVVTPELVLKYSGEFDIQGGANKLLSPKARAKYYRVRAKARAEYERVVSPALVKFNRTISPALAKFERDTAPARDKFDRVVCLVFSELYINDTL